MFGQVNKSFTFRFTFFMIDKCLALYDSSLFHYQHRNDVDNLFLRVCAILIMKNWRKITTHSTLACAPVKSWHVHFLNDINSRSSFRYHIQFGEKSIAKCFLTIIFSLTRTRFPIILNWKRVAIPIFFKKVQPNNLIRYLSTFLMVSPTYNRSSDKNPYQ